MNSTNFSKAPVKSMMAIFHDEIPTQKKITLMDKCIYGSSLLIIFIYVANYYFLENEGQCFTTF